jgi:hypothetical protein
MFKKFNFNENMIKITRINIKPKQKIKKNNNFILFLTLFFLIQKISYFLLN